MRRLRGLLLTGMAVLLLSALPAHALAPTEAFYVNDYVGVLSPENAEYLCQRGIELWRENGVQVVVVVVNNYVGESMESYANKVFNDFGIGSKDKNNGVLLIVAVDDGDVRIEVGDGLSGQIPDSRAGSILDAHFRPAASEGDIETAIYRTYLRLIQEGSRLDAEGRSQGSGQLERILGGVVGLVLVLVGVLFIVAARNASRRQYQGPGEPDSRQPAGGPPYTNQPAPNPNEPDRRGGFPGGGFFIGPWIRREEPRPSGGGGGSATGGGGGSRPGSGSQEPRPSGGGGGRSSGGGAGRSLLSDLFRGLGGSSGGSAPRGGGGGGFHSGGAGRGGGSGRGGGFGGGGRSSGGGAGRGFKR